MKRVMILDTTLRDGEQSPGCSMSVLEKVEVAKKLDSMGVDVIEAGFAASNDIDFDSIRRISMEVNNAIVSSLSRCKSCDIDLAYRALKDYKKRRIHLFMATSDIHLKYKLHKSRDEIIEMITKSVIYARKYFNDIEFSLEDATRTDLDFLCEVINCLIDIGVTTINIPDTVGVMSPFEYVNFINYLKDNSNLNFVNISVHCHDDLGMATANSISALSCGIDQIECTVNGIGERAGNAALEEVVAIINEKSDSLGYFSLVDTKKIKEVSDLVEKYSNCGIQKNKAIVGENAFLHEAGIHQNGVLENPLTYEVIDKKKYGINNKNIVIGIHSGKSAIIHQMKLWKYNIYAYDVEKILFNVKKYLENNKKITEDDLRLFIDKELIR